MTAMMRRAAILAVSALVLAACGDDTSSTPPTSTGNPATSHPSTTAASTTTVVPTSTRPTTIVPTTTAPVERTVVATYFSSNTGLLVAGSRAVPKSEALRAAVAAVVEGPNSAERAAGFSSAIPTGTALRGVVIVGRQAEVDLSAAFTSGGGSLSMRLRVAQILYTVVRLGAADSLRILIDGQRVESIGGEGLIVTNVKVGEFDDLMPPIVIEFPTPGATVAPGFVFKGLANVFEGTVNYELFDSRSILLTKGFATGMMGDWGPFSVTVNYAPGATGPLVLSVFTISPKDGARRDESRITLLSG